jgi:hypothetical protein
MNGGLSSSPVLGPFSLSWRPESGRGKPFVDVQRIVEVASPVSERIALFTKRERGCRLFEPRGFARQSRP